MWLHEGFAMYMAEERWWLSPQFQLLAWGATQHLPFDAMVAAFPHGADEAFARVAYFQSLMMFFAATGGPHAGSNRRGIREEHERTQQLVEALTSGAVTPNAAFAHAVGAQTEVDLEQAWSATLARVRDAADAGAWGKAATVGR